MRQTLTSVALLGTALVPVHIFAQQPHPVVQLEGYAGWRIPLGEVTQLADGADPSGVQLRSNLAFAGRVIFPIAQAPSHHLGKVFLGLDGSGSVGADMKLANTDSVVGQADYYHVAAVVGMGKFVPGTPVNLTLHGSLGLGIAHTAFNPISGITIAEEGNTATYMVTNATLGIDLYLGGALSVVTAAGLNIGIRAPLDVSLALLAGVALRLPN